MVTLTELFQSRQNEMLANMKYNLSHPVAKGNATETSWREFFKQYLPSRYSCDKAFIIDYKDNKSEEIDIVIYDNHFSPFILNKGEQKYIPAESVYAAFEVKQELNKKNFEYAQKKIASVRNLNRTSAAAICNGIPQKPRAMFNIIGGLLTTRGGWQKELLKQRINLQAPEHLDIGCCVEDKSWIVNKKTNKYIWSKDSKDSLLTFFMALLHKLQTCGTVPAIEIPKYFDGFK